MAAWDDIGSNIYGWVTNSPMEAGSLALGAAGTGMGIYDQYQAGQRMQERQQLAEQMMRMGPQAYNPNWSPQQLEAMYFRPAATFSAERGITSGGAFNNALAEAALSAERDRNQIGNQIFQSRLGALGYGQPQPAGGSLGAFGGAMNNVMLMRALQNRPQAPQSPMGATAPGSMMGLGDALQIYPQQAYQQPGQATGPWATNSMYEQTRENPWDYVSSAYSGGGQ